MKSKHIPESLTAATLRELVSFQGRSGLWLCQPTHRRHPDNQQDPIRSRLLVKALQTSLLQQHPANAVLALFDPFEGIAPNHDFCN